MYLSSIFVSAFLVVSGMLGLLSISHASFARVSAFSFPSMPECPGHHLTIISPAVGGQLVPRGLLYHFSLRSEKSVRYWWLEGFLYPYAKIFAAASLSRQR